MLELRDDCNDKLDTEACILFHKSNYCYMVYVAENCMKTCGTCNEDALFQINSQDQCITELMSNGYCNDHLNNIYCQYDGGDCCQKSPQQGWDKYCTVCNSRLKHP